MVERLAGGSAEDARGGEAQETPPRDADLSGGAPTEAPVQPLERPDPQGLTPYADVERDRARAALKARLFQIEAAPVRIGRYVILSRLGQGGMGIVYAAYDEDLDRKVAVKVVLPQGGSDRSSQRMRREAQAMARLVHPNIVGVYEVGEVGSQVFIAMEFVRGRSLDAWLRDEKPSWTEVLAVFRQAGRGLAAAHEAGLVHRDFKPHNVMLGDDGSVKVLDFGLAREDREGTSVEARGEAQRQRAGEEGSLTATGAIVGTPAFMSPEQHLGQPATARSDLFSFCVALYQGLHGTHPFASGSLPELVASVLSAEPREPPAGDPVPAWLRRVVLRGLAKRPEERHGSMSELLDALGRDLGARRRRRVLGAAAVALVFTGGFAAAQLGSSPEEPAVCSDPREQLEGTWSEARLGRVQAAVLGSDSARAEETWARVEPRLREHAQRWVEAAGASCEAHRSGERSDLLYERGRACLERSRAALDALAEALERPTASTIDHAVTAAAELPDPRRCDDVEALLAEVTPPEEAIAPEVASLRERLSRARVLEDAGRTADAIAVADEVLARAEALGYAPLRAEALLRRGSARLWAGEGPAADEDLGAAGHLAVEAEHDAVAAEAVARRIFVHSELLGRPGEAAIEVPWAESLVARVIAERPDPRLRSLVLNNMGTVWVRNGDHERGLALLRQALALDRESLPAEHPDIALRLVNVGRVERDLSRVTTALGTLREAARAIEVSLGPRHPHRAAVAINLADIAIELGRYDEAEAELGLADAILHDAGGATAMARVPVMLAQGKLAARRRRWGEARRAFEGALGIGEPAVGAEHPMLADAHFGLAEVELAEGRAEEAITRTRDRAEGLAEVLGPTHPFVAQGWVLTGRRQLEAGRPDEARASFERARELKRGAERVDEIGVAWTECLLGWAWLAAGEAARADALLSGCLEVMPETEPRRWLAMAAMAEAKRSQGDAAGAVAWLEGVESSLAAQRSAHDPELAWARARLERARLEAAPDDAARARARSRAERALETLSSDPGWSRESEEIRAWLHPKGPPP